MNSNYEPPAGSESLSNAAPWNSEETREKLFELPQRPGRILKLSVRVQHLKNCISTISNIRVAFRPEPDLEVGKSKSS